MSNTDDIYFRYGRIFAGIAMPGTKPGFCCCIGEKGDALELMVELEDYDPQSLISKASGVLYEYQPDRFYGDSKNDLVKIMLRETNRGLGPRVKKLSLIYPRLLCTQNPIQFAFSLLKARLEEANQKLFPENSMISSYMRQIAPSDLAVLKLGDFPAIEAVAFCILELTTPRRQRGSRRRGSKSQVDNTYIRP